MKNQIFYLSAKILFFVYIGLKVNHKKCFFFKFIIVFYLQSIYVALCYSYLINFHKIKFIHFDIEINQKGKKIMGIMLYSNLKVLLFIFIIIICVTCQNLKGKLLTNLV